MSVEVVWDNEDRTVMRFIFSKDWTWEEVIQAKIDCDARLDSVAHDAVAIIYDSPPDAHIPPDVLANARRVLSRNHPKAVLLVFVLTHTNVVARMLISTVARITGSVGARIRIAASVEDARHLIAKHFAQV
jgi:hypothetical protein